MEEDLKKPDQDSLSYKSSKVDVNELFGRNPSVTGGNW